MAKAKTPGFVLTLKLNTSSHDNEVLQERFFKAFVMRNKLVKHARKCLSGLRQDKKYRNLIEQRAAIEGKTDSASKKLRSDINNQLSGLRMQYGLSEYQFHSWMTVQKNKVSGIDINTSQKIASEVWKGVEAVLFRKGKSVHFVKFDNFCSIEGKNNSAGIRYRKGRVRWMGLEIQPQIRKGDAYARAALMHRVKYCRIVRRPMGITWHYYLQLVLEGLPPQKHVFLEEGRVGIDQGTSTEAVVSEKGCILTEICGERRDISDKAARIQCRMDRSKRAVNPQNYNADGTVKRGRRFTYSKSYKRDRMRLKTLYRRNAAYAKQSAEMLANQILCGHGVDIYTEPMSYKGLQARSKETKASEKTGRYVSKKRFGKSLAVHAPARFMAIVKRKLGYIGKEIHEVNGCKYRASQYDHVSDSYIKTALSSRSKMVGGSLVQRDLYSAFLLMCAQSPDKPDKTLCEAAYPDFLAHHNQTITNLLINHKRYPSCMGVKEFKFLLA